MPSESMWAFLYDQSLSNEPISDLIIGSPVYISVKAAWFRRNEKEPAIVKVKRKLRHMIKTPSNGRKGPSDGVLYAFLRFLQCSFAVCAAVVFAVFGDENVGS